MALTREQRARTVLILAAAGSAIGVALAGSLAPTLGGVLLVASWLSFLYALHAFGRGGA
jgi:hypothetical protein